MEALITQVVKEIPVAGALIFVMWMFLRHMKSREQEWSKGCGQAIKDNTEILSEVKTLIQLRIKQHE